MSIWTNGGVFDARKRMPRRIAGGRVLALQSQTSAEGHPGQVLTRMKSGLSGYRVLYLSRNRPADGRFSGLADWFGFQLVYCELDATGISNTIEAEIDQADGVFFAKSELDAAVRSELRRVCRDNRKMLVPLRTASRACFRNAILRILDKPDFRKADRKRVANSLELF